MSTLAVTITSTDRPTTCTLRVTGTKKSWVEFIAARTNLGQIEVAFHRGSDGSKSWPAPTYYEAQAAAVEAANAELGINDEAADPVGAADSSDEPEPTGGGTIDDAPEAGFSVDFAATRLPGAPTPRVSADEIVAGHSDAKALARAAAKAALAPVTLESGKVVPAYQVELIKAVREHAAKNYENGGWDYVVEAYSDDEIVEALGRAWSAKGAIKAVGKAVGVVADARSDAQAEA